VGSARKVLRFPSWWDWELELTPHVEKRMEGRRFTEVDLRLMLERATGLRRDIAAGRFVVKTRFRGCPWDVVVEPDEAVHHLVVVTAYRVEP
jgi:hypothetical protein